MNVNEQDQNIQIHMMNDSIQYNTPELATSTMSSDSNLSPASDCSKASANDHWRRASDLLRSNPSLMTREILFLTLKNGPPLHIVEFMVCFVINNLTHESLTFLLLLDSFEPK